MATPLQSTVYTLVRLFVERQKLVFEVFRTIRPYFLEINTSVRRTKEHIQSTQEGFWGEDNEWHYRFHGGGCRLVHRENQEPIEWDSPDLQRFDPFWFTNWVRWWGNQNKQSDLAQVIFAHQQQFTNTQESLFYGELSGLTFNVLEELSHIGLLRYHPNRTNMYELVSSTE